VQQGVFSRITSVELPAKVMFNPSNGKSQAFTISISADGSIPFPQIIIRVNGKEYIYNNEKIQPAGNNVYTADIPESDIPAGTWNVQVEGCRRKDWLQSTGEDWVKWYGDLTVVAESLISVPPASKNISVSKKKN